MARLIEQAGIRALEFNIGTPYASVTAKGNVTTELDPARVSVMVSTMRQAIRLPLWIKLTGQSERVPELARAAFDAGADSVVMAGRLLGFIPDVETLTPLLGTSLGIGGFWNLPITCHWLASTRAALGTDKPLIGINGAQSGLDIARMMLAGASAVAMASPVMLRGFGLLEDSLREFSDYLARQNLRAADLIGRAADQRKSFRRDAAAHGQLAEVRAEDRLNLTFAVAAAQASAVRRDCTLRKPATTHLQSRVGAQVPNCKMTISSATHQPYNRRSTDTCALPACAHPPWSVVADLRSQREILK